jgi:hypothetical protein
VLRHRAKIAAALATGVAVVTALSGCEVTQYNWANHFYSTSAGCLSGVATLHNGVGVGANGIEVVFKKVYYGDLNHDGVQDAVVFLSCDASPSGGNGSGSEIQIFTRDAKPLARLVEPDLYGSGNPFGSQFNSNNIGIHSNVLYTGAWSYRPNDPHCCPSAYNIFRWDWNGHGFTPVAVS